MRSSIYSTKRYQVTVERSTVTVNAASVYFAAIVYNAETADTNMNRVPALTNSTLLRVRAVGHPRVYLIWWRDVLEWANREAELAFGRTMIT